jgi:tetratricopeptide (TPR) repeat protein
MAPEIRGLNFLEGWAYERLGALEDAEQKYRQALEEDFGISVLRRETEIVAVKRENNMARGHLARILMRLGKMTEAESELLEVLKSDPADFRASHRLGQVYRNTGRMDAAVEQLRQLVESHPGYLAGWEELGQLYAERKNWKEAEVAFRKVVELDANHARGHFHLANVLNALGKRAEAGREMRIALDLDPNLGTPKRQQPP